MRNQRSAPSEEILQRNSRDIGDLDHRSGRGIPGASAHPFRMLGCSVELRGGLEKLKFPGHRGFPGLRNDRLQLLL